MFQLPNIDDDTRRENLLLLFFMSHFTCRLTVTIALRLLMLLVLTVIRLRLTCASCRWTQTLGGVAEVVVDLLVVTVRIPAPVV